MKKIFKLLFIGSLCGLALFITSCSDFLDVSDEVTQNLTLTETFENPDYVKRWHGGLFNCITEYSNTASGGNNGFTGIWCHVSGETLVTAGNISQWLVAGFNAGDTSSYGQRWTKLYQQIRDAMVFLDNVHPIGSVHDKTRLEEHEVNRMKAEAKFLIAYSYFSLFELYGPVPYLDSAVSSNETNYDFSRTPIDEFLSKVDNLLNEVIQSGHLPESLIIKPDVSGNNRYKLSEIVRPTKTAALALRAKLWVYAASPLFNGKYTDALKLTNQDGTHIFSEYDASKWQTAKIRLEDLFRDTDSKNHKLYEVKGSDGKIDADRSIYELFQSYNDEILWATGNNQYNGGSMEQNTRPRELTQGWGNSCVTQNTVDAFFDKNGLCINDPGTIYNPEGFWNVTNPCNNNKKVDNNIYGMYKDREPRFYANVIYEGKSWHIQPWDNFFVGFAKGEGSDNTSADSPRTGYLLGKFKNRQQTPYGDNIRTWARPSILFRLADFYLYYAEVLNEIDPTDPNIITYLDKIRHRAGIPGYKELKERNMKDIIGDQVLQRKAIHHERQIEMFAEGNRYFDVRRWMVCDAGQEGDQTVIWGMNMNGNRYNESGGPGSFYTRTVVESRAWRRAMYLYPIPDKEIQKSRDRLLVQNPLW